VDTVAKRVKHPNRTTKKAKVGQNTTALKEIAMAQNIGWTVGKNLKTTD
jgi:hypothetical protein